VNARPVADHFTIDEKNLEEFINQCKPSPIFPLSLMDTNWNKWLLDEN
jgi:hypothetical protein